jgi:glycosyltransferase involved in cell wall biosynthesis
VFSRDDDSVDKTVSIIQEDGKKFKEIKSLREKRNLRLVDNIIIY